MYLVIFIFGSMVMRSVMEEKISRIVEVMISSVKPFQLMLGKIVGVGLVGLTQLAIWMIIIPVIITVTTMAMGAPAASPELNQTAETIQKLQQENPDVMQTFFERTWLHQLGIDLTGVCCLFPGRLFYLLLTFCSR